MKKRMSRILSILLAFALIVSAGDVVQAEDVDGQTAEVQEMTEAEGTEEETQQEEEPEITVTPVEETTEAEEPVVEDKKGDAAQTNKETGNEVNVEEEETLAVSDEILDTDAEGLDVVDVPEMSKELITQATVSKSIPVKMAVTGSETLAESEFSQIIYSQTDTKGTRYCGYSQAFNAPAKGTLSFAVVIAGGTRGVYFGVYRDANMTQAVDTYVVSGVGSVASRNFRIPSAGTYYIGVNSTLPSGSNTTVSQAVVAGAIFYNGGDRTISSGQTIAVGQKDAQTNYFAIKASSTGYLMAQGDNTAKYYKVALCDSSKKALSGDTYLKDAPTYGVKAKKTYYLRVTSSSNSSGAYVFRATNTKISEKSGKSKKKAVTIKRKKTKSGTIEAGSTGKKADWYKFKLTKKKKVNISVEVGSNEKLKIVVYKGKRPVGNGTLTVGGNVKVPLKSRGKWTKGTYYIKVQRATSTSSGYYKLKWS